MKREKGATYRTSRPGAQRRSVGYSYLCTCLPPSFVSSRPHETSSAIDFWQLTPTPTPKPFLFAKSPTKKETKERKFKGEKSKVMDIAFQLFLFLLSLLSARSSVRRRRPNGWVNYAVAIINKTSLQLFCSPTFCKKKPTNEIFSLPRQSRHVPSLRCLVQPIKCLFVCLTF